MTITGKQIDLTGFQNLDADELKDSVREMLNLMTELERRTFIKTLQCEMLRCGLSLSDYLIPLGIGAVRADDLTPTEVGHLIRFFRINAPKAMSAVERALSVCPVSATGREPMTAQLLNLKVAARLLLK